MSQFPAPLTDLFTKMAIADWLRAAIAKFKRLNCEPILKIQFKTVVFYCSVTLGCWWRFWCHLYQLPSVEKPLASMKATVSSLTSTIWDLLGWLNRFMALTSWRIRWTGGAFLRDVPYFRLSGSQDNLISGGDERFISVSNLTKTSLACNKFTKVYKLTAHPIDLCGRATQKQRNAMPIPKARGKTDRVLSKANPSMKIFIEGFI